MKKSELISYFGTTTATAKALGVSKSTVSLWKKVVPWQYALLAEKVTNGVIKCSESEYPNITQIKK